MDSDNIAIGGDGILVEIDESKFAKRKYNRRYHVEGAWVVGGVERTPERKLFCEAVKDRSTAKLNDVISRHVLPGSIVLTDLWHGYLSVPEVLGLQHQTVSHSLNFVVPITGTHTNTIEGTWCGIKRKIPIRNKCGDTVEKHILEFIWRRKNCDNLWVGLMRAFQETQYE
jgi:hypothetical protein